MQRFVPLTQAPFGVAGLGEPVLRWVLSGVAVLGDENAFCKGGSGVSGLCVVLQCKHLPWETL